MSEMSELISIKQEPELDIVSDGECDTIFGISTDKEDSILDNEQITLKVRTLNVVRLDKQK